MSFTLITFPSPAPPDFFDRLNFVRSRFDRLLCSVAGGDDGEIRWNDFTAEARSFWKEETAALDLLRVLGSVAGCGGSEDEHDLEEECSSSRRNSFSIRAGLRSILHVCESEIEFIAFEGSIRIRGRKFWRGRGRGRERETEEAG